MDGLRYHLGADENGLGPRLGPLVVTAVLARVAPGGDKIVARRPRGRLAERLGDSKELVSHRDCALGQAWARALVARGAGKHGAATPEELVDALCLDERAALRAICPEHVAPQCWRADGEAFAAGGEIAGLLRDVHRDVDRLEGRGIQIVAVRAVVACAKRLNLALAEGKSRLAMDLHAMERLLLALREVAGAEVEAVCGKVGGYAQYGGAFGPLGGRLHAVVEQSRARSRYRFPGIGTIAFVMDGDASHLLVAMASLVGKYLREVLMARVVRHYRAHEPQLPEASGYHDPVTQGFVIATEALRRRLRVPDECFERGKLG